MKCELRAVVNQDLSKEKTNTSEIAECVGDTPSFYIPGITF